MFKKTRITNRIIWILAVFFVVYLILASIPAAIHTRLAEASDMSPSMVFILGMYGSTIWGIVALFLLCLNKKNKAMWKSFLPTKDGKSWRLLGVGALLGFLTNFFCILCALIHGDIKLYFDCALRQIPVFILALLMVFIQSSSEELWTRGFMYERISVHYPLWVAIVVNGVIFGLLHSFNPGVSTLAIVGICVTGLSYSLLRWYTGSIWTCMGIHTLWNFTQNFIFGLPNSGIVSETSIFHMDAVNAVSNPIYSYEFGVEAAFPALFIDALLGVMCIILAKRDGRLGELLLSKEGEAKLSAKGPELLATAETSTLETYMAVARDYPALAENESAAQEAAPVDVQSAAQEAAPIDAQPAAQEATPAEAPQDAPNDIINKE